MMKPIAFLMAFLAASSAYAADMVLAIGQVSVIRPDGKIATVVVGNPEVADVVAEGDSTVLVLARKVGQTDVLVLGRDRQVLDRARVTVAATAISDNVTVRRGTAKGVSVENLACRPGMSCAKVEAK